MNEQLYSITFHSLCCISVVASCWANHINFSADARGREALVNIECPEPGCGEALRSRIIQKFGDPTVLLKRHAWILDTFASEAQSLRRCANPTREVCEEESQGLRLVFIYLACHVSYGHFLSLAGGSAPRFVSTLVECKRTSFVLCVTMCFATCVEKKATPRSVAKTPGLGARNLRTERRWPTCDGCAKHAGRAPSAACRLRRMEAACIWCV